MANFPTSPKPSGIRIGSHYQNVESRTASFNRQVASRGGHRWSFSLVYLPQLHEDFAEFFSFLHGLKGRFGVCTFTLPNYPTRSTITYQSGVSSIALTDARSNGQSVTVEGLAVGTVIKKGDFFRFANHTKTYMASSDVTVDSAMVTANSVEITFCPALVRQVTETSHITFGSEFQVAQKSDDLSVDFSSDQTLSTSVELIEVLDSSGGASVY